MTSSSPKQEKDALRKEYKEKRKALPKEEKERRDAGICRRAASLAVFRFAKYVLLYDATESEISLSPLAREALARGKVLAYPRCDTESRTMTFHTVSSPDELVPDAYGIKAPRADAPVFAPGKYAGSAVCFVPGLVFDRGGFRLGYGKGYYDRFLSSFPGSSVGVIYSDFLVPRLPRGRYDRNTDILLTEQNVIIKRE